jgi:hypothetical protein
VIASVLLSTTVVIVLFGGGDHFDPLVQLLRGKLLFAGMLMLVVSLIAAWKWESIGGLFILVCGWRRDRTGSSSSPS